MARLVKVAFASCKPDLIPAFIQRFSEIAPHLELFVVSEFPPPQGRWIPYRVDRSLADNRRRCASALRGCSVRIAAIMLQPGAPYALLRILGWQHAPLHTLFYNSNLDHFVLRPGSLRAIARHFTWRLREQAVYQLNPGGDLYTWLWRLRHPKQLKRPLGYAAARFAGWLAGRSPVLKAGETPAELPGGISVVIPSRNGRPLLERLLPLLGPEASEVIVVDNGSNDETEPWLRSTYPQIRIESSTAPLSFARAVNRGILAARYSHVCLLNNDMIPASEFLSKLRTAFDDVPDLFCATAQIFFPEGKRREETGKAVIRALPRHRRTTDFPVHCIEPLPGEDESYVLYGSGGCSLYDTRKLRMLGCINELYEPAYVEDLDAGVRAWQRGWPTVFVSGAKTIHQHRSTTSRYYDEAELARVLERNWLRFLAGTIVSRDSFREMWADAIERLNLKAALEHDQAAADILSEAWRIPLRLTPPSATAMPEEEIFAVGSGDVAIFPGGASRHPRTVVIASCYIPYPLSHGGAVRMYNLMRRGARDTTQILITFVDELHTPPAELLDICVEIVQVRRHGSHVRRDTGRPDVVEEFDSTPFRAALRQTVRKWKPQIAQLEFTQMAQYVTDCVPARTILVEHDITLDLYRQLLAQNDDYDVRQQLARWERFERRAWVEADCIVTMSEKDRATVEGALSVEVLPNGVDLERFHPSTADPEPGRLLFIGSFAHLPNLLALDFFLRDVWPLLAHETLRLHVIAGSRHRYFYDRARDRLSFSLDTPGLELEDFVSDVRPAYERASVVIAPLLASAGTNIKIMEAMAMGKAIVSTTGGINGLHELAPGLDILVENDAKRIAQAINGLLANPELRRNIQRNARRTAERVYDWDKIAETQRRMYDRLAPAR